MEPNKAYQVKREWPGTDGHMLYQQCEVHIETRRKIKIAYLNFGGDKSACVFLRVIGPMKFLKACELIWCIEVHGNRATVDNEAIDSSDLVVIQRTFANELTTPLIDSIIQSGKPVVYEIDDLLFDPPESNPHYKSLIGQRPYLINIIKKAAAITVTTEALKKALAEYNRNIIVLPNLIDIDAWKMGSQQNNKTESRTIIGFAGTRTHKEDLKATESALLRISEKYGDLVGFCSFGCASENMYKLPNHQFINFEMSYESYLRKLQTIDIDVAIAPLENNEFNQCKSNIKWLEYSAAGIAGVYSKMKPYSSCIEQGCTGMLVENDPDSWFNAIDHLIINREERLRIAQNAKNKVLNTYCFQKHAHLWEDTYRRIIRLHNSSD